MKTKILRLNIYKVYLNRYDLDY